MKHAIIIAAMLSIAATAQTETTSALSVEEVFSVETSEELEASLTDGYPMPWLAEILEDETIPEEDRYWLDCRVRAIIAQDLHLFYDREGNPVHVEADWIRPSNSYWRENFIISPLGESTVTYPVETGGNLTGHVGHLVNRMGHSIGTTALSAQGFSSSRDASIWASALCRIEGNYKLVILHSNGNYIIPNIEMDRGRCTVSESGHYILLSARGRRESNPPNKAILLNREGEILWETELETTPTGNACPVISPNDKVCVIATQSSNWNENGSIGLYLQILSMKTGEELYRVEDPSALSASFSPDGQLTFIPTEELELSATLTSTGQSIWSNNEHPFISVDSDNIGYISGSNTAKLFTMVIMPLHSEIEGWYHALFSDSGSMIAVDRSNRNLRISPNDFFVFADNFNPRNGETTTIPISISRISSGGE